MKSNYIRIFLIALIVVIFMSLTARWEEMFVPKPAKTESGAQSTQLVQQENNAQNKAVDTVITDVTKQDFSNADAKPISLNTSVFANLEISLLNGAIINAELKDYDVSLTDKQPMPMLNNNAGTRYIAQSVIYINDQPQSILFTEQSVVKKDSETAVTLAAKVQGLEVIRQYHINDLTYAITVKQSVKNTTNTPISVSFDNEITRQVPPETHSFSILDAHSYSFQGVGLSSNQRTFQKESFADLAKSTAAVNVSTSKGWAAMIQHYFVSLWVPSNPGTSFSVYANKLAEHTYQSGVKTQAVVLSENQSVENVNILYTGPTITKNLEAMVKDFGANKPEGLDKLVDYGMLSFISVIIFWLMTLIHSVVANWGLAIILVTVLIKVLFYPLSAKSYKSMAKMRMLQPRMKKLQELYKGDRQKLGRKMMEMYKEEKVNPASGCLPILVQIPVFIALYWVLLESVQLRQAPFVFWINDLASKDPYFILPILMGISMFVQQKLSPTSADPTQAKIMMLMPVIFTVFFASFPSGLVLYWLTNNVISIAQQWYITRKYTAIYKAKRA
ncbi:membrane protein insertase YidC [Caedibacter taeniospiralis]|uniref:membrane protein insertase YidC n=1 Tax=Caedibacter taeniospiralis TaxID=28907 RepID=UPI000C27D18A|nr:membrane protein insertase YidC [Caedibacter taeniospiralis]